MVHAPRFKHEINVETEQSSSRAGAESNQNQTIMPAPLAFERPEQVLLVASSTPKANVMYDRILSGNKHPHCRLSNDVGPNGYNYGE